MGCWQSKLLLAASVLLSGALLSGCASRLIGASTEQLAADQKGVVVVFSDAPTVCSRPPNLVLGRFHQESNGWIAAAFMNNASINRASANDVLLEKALPAGEYGIVQMNCSNPVLGGFAGAKTILLDVPRVPSSQGGRSVIARPLAIFTVRPGEVVNIGAIVAAESGPKTFTYKVGPIAPELLAQFAAAMPALSGQMVTRLMTVPAAPWPVALNASPIGASGTR